MAFQYVIVQAWVPDWSGGGGSPTHPIAPGGSPPEIWPSPGVPTHPIAPGGPPLGFWGGRPPEYPDQGLPPQLGLWPGQGVPTHPIAPGGPPPGIWPSPGRPTHPIAPGGPPLGIWGGAPIGPNPPGVWPGPGQPPGIWPGPGQPPGIWGGRPIGPNPPYPDQSPPPEQPGIWPGPGFGNDIWGGRPIGPNPPTPTFPIVIPPSQDMPEHPELPDLNAGDWIYVKDQGAVFTPAFVPWPLAVTHPDYNPNYPTEGTPGRWVIIAYGERAVWAWIPTSDSSQPAST